MNTPKSNASIDVIKKEQFFNHSIDKIWSAISEQDKLSTWFIPADFKAEVGYEYTFTAPSEQNCTQIKGIIKSAKPYTLIYTWIVAGTDTETTVTWKLEPKESGTILYLEHTGISNYPGDNAIKMFESFNGGWDNCLSGLMTYLSK